MCERAVSQRASLERRLYELPALRAAMRDGRVTYEKARIVAAAASERTLDAWIERASRLPCIALAREAEAAEEQQTCAAGELSCRLPRRVASLLVAALRSAQAASGRLPHGRRGARGRRQPLHRRLEAAPRGAEHPPEARPRPRRAGARSRAAAAPPSTSTTSASAPTAAPTSRPTSSASAPPTTSTASTPATCASPARRRTASAGGSAPPAARRAARRPPGRRHSARPARRPPPRPGSAFPGGRRPRGKDRRGTRLLDSAHRARRGRRRRRRARHLHLPGAGGAGGRGDARPAGGRPVRPQPAGHRLRGRLPGGAAARLRAARRGGGARHLPALHAAAGGAAPLGRVLLPRPARRAAAGRAARPASTPAAAPPGRTAGASSTPPRRPGAAEALPSLGRARAQRAVLEYLLARGRITVEELRAAFPAGARGAQPAGQARPGGDRRRDPGGRARRPRRRRTAPWS